jgi:AmiS/UreI family transporter
MPPISVVFVITGLAVFVIALAFLGVGAEATEDGPNPLVTVGWLALAAGAVDLVEAIYILAVRPTPLGDPASVPLAGLVTFYGTFFLVLGISLVKGLDLRPVANLSIAVAIVPLFWWEFFAGGWMFRSILVVWAIVFLAVTATVYGKLGGKVLGGLLMVTSLYTFLAPAALLALGVAIP